MATTAMVNAYLEQPLLEEYGDDVGAFDAGFEIPLAGGLRIGVIDGNHRTRRVPVTARVIGVVDITLDGRFLLLDNEVQVEGTLLAEGLAPASLLDSIGFVVSASDTNRDMLLERFEQHVDVAAGTASDGSWFAATSSKPMAGGRERMYVSAQPEEPSRRTRDR